MSKKDGKNLEKELSNKIKTAYRLYDNHSGFIPAQPADFYIPKYFIEVKDTNNPKGLRKSNLSKKQLAKQKIAKAKGIDTYYYIYFKEVNKAVFVPFEVVYKFYYTKGKGVLTWNDVKGVYKEGL